MSHLAAWALPAQTDTTTTTTTPNPAEGLLEVVTNPDRPCDSDQWVCRQVYEWTESERWANTVNWALAKPLTILLIIIVAVFASRILRWVVRRVMERTLLDGAGQDRMSRLRAKTPAMLLATGSTNLRREARAQTLITVFRGLASALVWFVAFVAILDQLQIDLGPLVAGAGIAGVALGFGAQNMVRDFLTGAFIILEDQYGVGDIVDLGEAVGTVEKVTLRVTRVRDVNGAVWHVPNGEIKRVANSSQDWARALLDVEVAYGTDLDAASKVLQDTANALSADAHFQHKILESPEVWGVQDFGPTGVSIRVVLKTRPAVQWEVLRELRRRIHAEFEEAGIEIPSQRTVFYRSGDPPSVRMDQQPGDED